MKIIFITPYPPGEAPSQRFRFEQYLPLLPQSYQWEVKSFFTIEDWKKLYTKKHLLAQTAPLIRAFLKRIILLFSIKNFDVVFIHREATPIGPPFFEWIITKWLKKKVIYDFDDAIWLEDPSEKGSLKAKVKWKRKIAKICQWSWKISAGNGFIASFAKIYNKNVFIIPTTIDTEHLHNPKLYPSNSRSSSKTVIGWTGTHSTLPYLTPLLPVIQKIEEVYDIEFLVIANKNPFFKLKSFRYVPWNKTSEIDDLMKIDIGIMPLDNNTWSEGKCGFKLLQYMALEKAVVTSPVGVNSEIVKDKINGFISINPDEWFNNLEDLICCPNKRKQFGLQGRKTVIQHYSVSSNLDNFLALFE